MDNFKATLPVLLAVGGLILLVMDLVNMTIHMRGADSVAGALLLGFGVLALTQKQE